MVSLRKAQTGKRIYRGVSISPNKGPVSGAGQQGYLRREMRNKNKKRAPQLGGRPVVTGPGKPGGRPPANGPRPVVPPRPPGPGNGPVRGGKRPGKGFKPPRTKPGGRPPANGPRPVVSPMYQDTTQPPNPFQQIPTYQDTSPQDTAYIPQVGINLPGGGHTLPPPQPPGINLPGGGHLPQPPGINLPGGGHTPPVGVFGGGTGPYNPNPNGMIGGGGPPGMHGGQTNVTKPGIDPGTGGPIMPYGNMQQAFNGRRPPPGNPTGGSGNGTRPPGPGSTPAPMPNQLPQVQVTKDGILQLPYNQQVSADQLAAVSDANNELLALKMGGDEQALKFAAEQRMLEQQNAVNQTNTLNANASGGTAFSSAYGTQVAGNARDYANQSADLQSQNTGFLNNQALQRAQVQSGLNAQLQQIAQGYAAGLGPLLGNLGFGQATPAPVPSPGPRRPTGGKKPTRRKRGKGRRK